MKTKILIVFFLLLTGIVSGQIKQLIGGAPNLRSYVRGTIEGDSGMVLKSFPDTLTANRGTVIKKIDGLLIRIKDSIFFRDTAKNKWVNLTTAPGMDSNDSGTILLSGSAVITSGFAGHTTLLRYKILGKYYTAAAAAFTLPSSHAAQDKYAQVYADTLGYVGVITGANALPGLADRPQVNPRSQILIADYLIKAGSSTPFGVSNVVVYAENNAGLEWAGSTNIAGGLFNYSTSPHTGLVSTRIPSFTNLDYVKFQDGVNHQLTEFTFLKLWIKLSENFSNNFIAIGLHGTRWITDVAVIRDGQYGFDKKLINIWQAVVVPVTAFPPLSADRSFNTVEFNFRGIGGAVQLDNIALQRGGAKWLAPAGARFGIEDNIGIQDRYFDADRKDFQVYNGKTIYLTADYGLQSAGLYASVDTVTTFISTTLISKNSSGVRNMIDIRPKYSAISTPLNNQKFVQYKTGDYFIPLSVNGIPADSSGNIPMAGAGVSTLQNVTNIAGYSGGDSLLIIKDAKRGGNFTRYFSTYAADGGVVFTDVNGVKWKRVITGNYINLNWYGAVSNNTGTNDIYSLFNAAIAASNNAEILTSGNVYIPAPDIAGHFFYCSQRITLNSRVKIFGDGSGKSHIRWAGDVGGFYASYITSRGSEFSGITLSAYNRTGIKAGIELKDIIHCTDVTVQEFGMGFLADNAIPTGNSNNSTFTNCLASQNNVHGFYFRGPDANAMKITNCDAVSNGGLGISDQSFLGNHYYGIHAATNGGPDIAWQKGLVKVGTLVYAAIRDNPVNITPGVTTNWQSYWVLLTGSDWNTWATVLTYNNATTYYTVGPWNMDGDGLWPGTGQNQSGTIMASYMEYDQVSAYIGPINLAVGGNALYRTPTALLAARGSAVYTKDQLSVGDPSSTTGIKVSLGSSTTGGTRGIGVFDAAPGGVFLDYFTGTGFGGNSGAIKTHAGGSHTRFLMANTTAANAGRTTIPVNAGNLALLGPMYFTTPSERAQLNQLDFLRTYWTLPNPLAVDGGDMWLVAGSLYNDMKTEYVTVKKQNLNAGQGNKYYSTKGFMEDILTSVSGTYPVLTDYNMPTGTGILYDVTFAGSAGADDCVIHREVLVTKKIGVPATIVSNVAIRADYVPGGFATAAFTLVVNSEGDDITLNLVNLPTGTNGKVNVKRIDY